MKISDEILIDIGFTYNKDRDEFVYSLPWNNEIIIFNTNGYWLYFNSQNPGNRVETVGEILDVVTVHSIKYGSNEKQKEIIKALGL